MIKNNDKKLLLLTIIINYYYYVESIEIHCAYQHQPVALRAPQ